METETKTPSLARYEWCNEQTTAGDLSETLNGFERDGYEVFSILPVGPYFGQRDERNQLLEIDEAIYLIVVARRPLDGAGPGQPG